MIRHDTTIPVHPKPQPHPFVTVQLSSIEEKRPAEIDVTLKKNPRSIGIIFTSISSLMCSVSHLDEDFVKRLSNHYKEPTELEIQEMVNILVSGEAYDKVFNHLDMLHAPLKGKVLIITTAKWVDGELPNQWYQRRMYLLHINLRSVQDELRIAQDELVYVDSLLMIGQGGIYSAGSRGIVGEAITIGEGLSIGSCDAISCVLVTGISLAPNISFGVPSYG
ncbi:hypothetical protein Tco_1540593 [Tanacetum coccineum]